MAGPGLRDLAAPALLVPTGDPKPVERAVVDGILDDFEPETFLWITFNRPDGGAHVWYAWTQGGAPLGDSTDQDALLSGYDCADWLHALARHCTEHHRGRVTIQAHALRGIQRDVSVGWRAGEAEQARLRRVLDCAADMDGQSRRPVGMPLPRWVGVGPGLLTRN